MKAANFICKHIIKMTTKKITKKESKIADLFLEELLSIDDRNFLYRDQVLFFFNRHKTSSERAEFICKKLELNNIIELKTKGAVTTTFDKKTINSFLNNGGTHCLWLTNNKFENDARLSRWQVITFWPLLAFGLFGGLYSSYDIMSKLNTQKYEETKEMTIGETKLDLSKLRTLILFQKKDTLLVPTNSEKRKKN
jgi:hypothetical protein